MKDIAISIFKDLFKTQDVPHNVPLWKSLERIKVGKSKELIKQIRQGDKELKKKLPSILFAGEFSERNGNGLVKHSGLMVVDFDKFPSDEVMRVHLDTLRKNPHFVTLFISPSGQGIKGVVKVPNTLDKNTHPKYFKAFDRQFDYEYFDKANSNVDRVCFESYDPEIFINYEAETFEPEIKDEGYSMTEKAPILPVTNEDVIISKIMEWNWKRDFKEGERNQFIFDVAGAFCEYGVSQTTAEGYILNNVVWGDFSEKEAITAINSAYRSRVPNSKYFEDFNRVTRVKKDLHKGKKEVMKTHKIEESTFEIIKEEKEHEDFWFYDNKKPKIDNLKYKFFLERNGFKKYFPADSQKPTWVRVSSNIVRETSVEKIKDFVLNYLLDRNEFDVWRYAVNYSTIFSENYLLMLDSIELRMLKDKKHKCFIAYQNGILEITKDEAKLIEYIDIDSYVWESQIIKRDFLNTDNLDNDYKTFINNISHKESLSIECTIGYLLSTYKNKMNNKAIILNDEVISDNPEGGTGKGLLVQGLKQIRQVSILDGKNFDDKKSFPYQTVSQDTQILVWDDVAKNFNFETKFSVVTEGITLERKNKDAIKLNVEDSPKMVISTNYAIRGEGNSHDRRRHELEIAQYYGKDKTPFDEFGRQLFDDWTAEEFTRFDNYMVYCIQCYLKEGLIKQTAKNLKKRKFIMETSHDFYEWIIDKENFPRDVRKEKTVAFNEFVEEYQDFKKWLSRKRFGIWIEKYCDFAGFTFRDGKTQGERWFLIQTEKEKTVEEKLDEVPF